MRSTVTQQFIWKKPDRRERSCKTLEWVSVCFIVNQHKHNQSRQKLILSTRTGIISTAAVTSPADVITASCPWSWGSHVCTLYTCLHFPSAPAAQRPPPPRVLRSCQSLTKGSRFFQINSWPIRMYQLQGGAERIMGHENHSQQVLMATDRSYSTVITYEVSWTRLISYQTNTINNQTGPTSRIIFISQQLIFQDKKLKYVEETNRGSASRLHHHHHHYYQHHVHAVKTSQ